MSDDARDSARSLEEISARIATRLRSRSPEIEQAIYARIQEAVPDPIGSKDPAYQTGVRGTITAVVDYSLDSIERGPEWSGPILPAAATQARRAARTGVSLGTVMRRYFAGHGELGEFVMKEAHHCGLSNHGPALHHIRRTQEALLERVTAAIEREYNQELERIARPSEQSRAEIVQRLLSGEPVDSVELAELNYEIHTSWHLAVIAIGAGAEEFLQRLKAHYGRKLLAVSLNETVWAWLGGKQRPTVTDIERLSTNGHMGLTLAIGELGRGIDGWRLTHHQARAALGVALRKPERVALYADGRLLAAALQNDTLAMSLKQKYLTPLGSQRDGGATLRHTLRAYIDAECIATSAASPLKVGRHTVESRVRTVETLLGCPLRACLTELDVALRLEELDRASATDDMPPKH